MTASCRSLLLGTSVDTYIEEGNITLDLDSLRAATAVIWRLFQTLPNACLCLTGARGHNDSPSGERKSEKWWE